MKNFSLRRQTIEQISSINEVYFLDDSGSLAKAESFIQNLLKIKKNHKGFMIFQLENPQYEWGSLRKTHLLLHAADKFLPKDFLIIHLNFPTNPLVTTPQNAVSLVASEKALLDSFANEMNSEAWLSLSLELYASIKEILAHLKLEATDEYQLEALLKAYVVELDSLFLKPHVRMLAEALDKILYLEPSSPEALHYEAILITQRRYLNEFLKSLSQLLREIVFSIESILEYHRELLSLYQKSVLLNLLIKDHISELNLSLEQKWLLIQLLAEKLNFETLILGSPVNLRFREVFALKLALTELLQHYSFQEVLKLVADKVEGPCAETFQNLLSSVFNQLSYDDR